MTIRDQKGKVMDRIPVKRVLLSVSEKKGLDDFVLDLVDINPDVLLLSSTGTYTVIKQTLREKADHNLMEVGVYTGSPEMEGGLVKTLHPKIHGGILGERNYSDHQIYLHETLTIPGTITGDYIDMVVVNLYPFAEKIKEPGCTFEKARGYIDIGGHAMLRAAAKNFLGCAAVCDPVDYSRIIDMMRENDGCTPFNLRFNLMRKAFSVIAEYDKQIGEYMEKVSGPETRELYLSGDK